MLHTLIERTLGQYPVSIATSLALESLMNIHPDFRHPRVPVYQYKVLWINVGTLIRNLLGACTKDDRIYTHTDDLVTALLEEFEFIESLGHNEAKGLKIRFYYSQYKDFPRVYKEARLQYSPEHPLTDNQRVYKDTLDVVLEKVTRKLNNPQYPKEAQYILVCEDKIRVKEVDKALILTHYAYDLLSHYNFNQLELLESHTGKIKKRIDWYTKMPGAKKLPTIPFSEAMIQVFGDGALFNQLEKKVRDDVIDVANKRKWHQLTSRDKMRADLVQFGDKELFDYDKLFSQRITL